MYIPGLKLPFRIREIVCNGIIRHLSPWNKSFAVMDKKSICGGKGGEEAERKGQGGS